jgi:hypothetical protein
MRLRFDYENEFQFQFQLEIVPSRVEDSQQFENAEDTCCLSQAYIKECQPILKGLQSKTAKDESYPERPEPTLRKIVSVVFDVRIDRHPDAGDDPCHQPYANRKRPGVVHLMDENATDEGCGRVTESTDHSAPKLTTREPWTARRCIIESRTHAAGVGEYLADGDENGK